MVISFKERCSHSLPGPAPPNSRWYKPSSWKKSFWAGLKQTCQWNLRSPWSGDWKPTLLPQEHVIHKSLGPSVFSGFDQVLTGAAQLGIAMWFPMGFWSHGTGFYLPGTLIILFILLLPIPRATPWWSPPQSFQTWEIAHVSSSSLSWQCFKHYDGLQTFTDIF